MLLYYAILTLFSSTFSYANVFPMKLHNANDIFNLSKEKAYKLVSIMPKRNENPVDSSLVYIGYTQKEIVVYAMNFQKCINANSKIRDAAGLAKGQEDNIAIIIAPFGKENECYYSKILSKTNNFLL